MADNIPFNWKYPHSYPPSEHEREYRRKAQEVRRKAKIEWCQTYKMQKGCKECGEKDFRCLDFHHPEGRNESPEIRVRCLWKRSWDEMMATALICEVLCANCHRKLEWNKRHPDGKIGSEE